LETASYAALGCAAGAATSGNCGTGAVGSITGFAGGKLGLGSGGSSIASSLAVAIAGGDVKDIYAGSNIGANSSSGAYVSNQIPALYQNPTTGEIFSAYGQLVVSSGDIV